MKERENASVRGREAMRSSASRESVCKRGSAKNVPRGQKTRQRLRDIVQEIESLSDIGI